MKLMILFRQVELENMGQPDSTRGEEDEEMNKVVLDENFTWESLLL